jgi:hypothetical protein
VANFNLEQYEYHVYTRSYEAAAKELLDLLSMLDHNLGQFNQEFVARPTSPVLGGEDYDTHVLTRLAAATACMLADPGFKLSARGIGQLLNWHRWLSTLFAAGPLRNADSVLRALNLRGVDSEQIEVREGDLYKLCLMYSADSRMPLDVDALWQFDRALAAGLCLTLLAPRFCGSPEAHSKRELILPWLSARLDQVGDLDLLPTGILHDAYMHCSYADRADKHDIKRPINALISRKLLEWGCTALDTPPLPPSARKPVMLVVLEWFHAAHSIYRTHSRTMEAAREIFEVVAIGVDEVDAAGRAVFDAFHELPPGASTADQLHFIRDLARKLQAQVLYMPSVGMFPLTMFLANLRLAPLQVYALGHPATTHAEAMDYAVVEEDYVGDPACFSERLLVLPRDGMPYRPSAAAAQLPPASPMRENPQIVQIAVAATTMKLNPRFLGACARIAREAGREVRFHFLVGQALGLVYVQVARVVRQYLGDAAVVHRHQPYASYMEVISGCDLFLNPFPFGNTNGIVDTVSAGLVGVCKTGREVHEHIDEGLFGRLGLPSWMVAHTVDEYVEASLRLIRNDAERCELRRLHAGADRVKVLFEGRPEIFGQKLAAALEELHANAAAGPSPRAGRPLSTLTAIAH